VVESVSDGDERCDENGCWRLIGLLAAGYWLLVVGRPLRPPSQRYTDVTRPTQQSIVLQAALTSAIGYWNNVIRFPAWACCPPGLSRHPIARCWLRSRPCAMSLDHIEPADLTDSFVALLDLPPNVPGTASDFPFVNARVAAERAPRGCDGSVAPPADWFSSRVSVWLAPLFCCDDTSAASAHAMGYRRM
jgi:hypothetical protein